MIYEVFIPYNRDLKRYEPEVELFRDFDLAVEEISPRNDVWNLYINVAKFDEDSGEFEFYEDKEHRTIGHGMFYKELEENGFDIGNYVR